LVISRRCFTKDGREKYQNEKCTSEACRNHYFSSLDMQICDVLVPLPYSFIRELKQATSVFEPRTKTGIKGELKGEISNFSNIFFAKSNISEVNFVKLFSLVYCFLRENYVGSWIFPAFATSSSWAQKTKSVPCCDV